MTICQLQAPCWTDPDDDTGEHFSDEDEARESLTAAGCEDIEITQTGPCWVANCDGACRKPLPSDEFAQYHGDTIGDLKSWAAASGWTVTPDGSAYCDDDRPPALKARPGDQPLPVPNGYADVQSMVIADIEARRELGIQRYKTALQPFNQRDGLIDAYEESVDLTCYLRQLVAERGALAAGIRKLIAAAVAEAGHAGAGDPAVTDCVMEALGPLLTAAAFRTDPGMVTVPRADLELILACTGPLADKADAALSRLLDAVEPS